MCKNMSICLRWGNSCGTSFNVKKFCKKNPIWSYWGKYMDDRPTQPWSIFSLNSFKSLKSKKVKRNNIKNMNSKKKSKKKDRK